MCKKKTMQYDQNHKSVQEQFIKMLNVQKTTNVCRKHKSVQNQLIWMPVIHAALLVKISINTHNLSPNFSSTDQTY